MPRGLSVGCTRSMYLRPIILKLTGVNCVAVYQMVYSTIWVVQVDGSPSFFLNELPGSVWVFVVLAPLTALVFGFMAKSADKKSYDWEMQNLRSQFDTRLGMYSP